MHRYLGNSETFIARVGEREGVVERLPLALAELSRIKMGINPIRPDLSLISKENFFG